MLSDIQRRQYIELVKNVVQLYCGVFTDEVLSFKEDLFHDNGWLSHENDINIIASILLVKQGLRVSKVIKMPGWLFSEREADRRYRFIFSIAKEAAHFLRSEIIRLQQQNMAKQLLSEYPDLMKEYYGQ